MIKIWLWITENWRLFATIGLGMVFLSLTGNITEFLRNAKKGLANLFTPLGMFVGLCIAIMMYIAYLNLMKIWGTP